MNRKEHSLTFSSRAIFTRLAVKDKRKHFLSKLSVFDIEGLWQIIWPELWCLCTQLLMEQIKWFNELMSSSSVFLDEIQPSSSFRMPLSLSLHPKTLKGFCLWNPHLPLPLPGAATGIPEMRFRGVVWLLLPLCRWSFLPLLINTKQLRERLKGTVCLEAFFLFLIFSEGKKK